MRRSLKDALQYYRTDKKERKWAKRINVIVGAALPGAATWYFTGGVDNIGDLGQFLLTVLSSVVGMGVVGGLYHFFGSRPQTEYPKLNLESESYLELSSSLDYSALEDHLNRRINEPSLSYDSSEDEVNSLNEEDKSNKTPGMGMGSNESGEA